MAYKLGTTRDEIRRNKDKSKMTMRVIRNARSAVPGSRRPATASTCNRMNMSGTSFSRGTANPPTYVNPVKAKMGRVTQFNISGTGLKQPINITTGFSVASARVSRPSTAKSSWAPVDPLSRIASLTEMYNHNLEEVVSFD